jgi:hypothetical protein
MVASKDQNSSTDGQKPAPGSVMSKSLREVHELFHKAREEVGKQDIVPAGTHVVIPTPAHSADWQPRANAGADNGVGPAVAMAALEDITNATAPLSYWEGREKPKRRRSRSRSRSSSSSRSKNGKGVKDNKEDEVKDTEK